MKAIEYDSSATCIATAGSGKTTVLVEKVVRIADTVNPSRILCVAFNNNAVDNMRKRLSDRDSKLSSVKICTLHSLGLACIKSLGGSPKIITEQYNKVNFSNGSIISYGVVDIMNEVLNNYRSSLISRKEHIAENMLRYVGMRLSTMQSHSDCFSEFEEYYPPRVLEKILNNFITKMESNNFITFDMMCWKAVNLLRANSKLRDKVQNRFDYVLIDECQDLSKDQYEMIKIISAKCKLFMVGDGLQSIYNFRGSDSQFLLKAHDDIDNMTVLHLPINYRCDESIINTANHIARITDEANDENYMDAIAFNKGGNKPVVQYAINSGKEVCNALRLFEGEWKSKAVLARTNATLLRLKTALFKNKIPCFFNNKFGLPKEVKIFCDYLELILNVNNDEAFSKVINVPFRYISKAVLEKVKEIAAEENCSLFESISNITPKEKCYHNVRDFIGSVKYVSTHKYKTVPDMLTDMVNMMQIEDAVRNLYKGDDEAVTDALDNINALIEESKEYTDARTYAENLLEAVKTNDENGVVLSTVHKAKGLEWDSVVIADFNDGMFPHKRSNNIQEELHILYVAITRAKRNLVFVCNDDGIESPFLEAMKDTVVKADYEINKCA